MMIKRLLNYKILYFVLLFLICFNFYNFVGFKEVKDDNIDYLKYTLNFAIHNKQSADSHQDQIIKKDDERSIGYSFLSSLLLIGQKNQLKKKSLNCFLKGEDKFCKNVIIKLQFLNFVFYIMIIFSIIIITFKLINNLFYSLLGSILFSTNTFFITNISMLNPEIISAFLVLWLSFFTYKFYIKKNYSTQLMLVILSSLLYFFKPVFIFYFLFLLIINIFLDIKFYKTLTKKNLSIIFIFVLSILPIIINKSLNSDNAKKISINSETIVKIRNTYYNKYSLKKDLNIMKDYKFHDNILPDNTGGEVFMARSVYGLMKWSEIPPLIISFLPKINIILLKKFYEAEEIERIMPGATFEGRNRNFYLIYRSFIAEEYLIDKGYDIQKLNTLQKSLIIYLNTSIKQIILTPIFTLRGIFSATNLNIISEKFNNNQLIKLYKLFAILTFLIQFFGLMSSIYFFIKIILSKVENKLIYFIMVPSYSILFHSILTHYIPRYSQPLIPVVYIFFMILVYQLIINKKKI